MKMENYKDKLYVNYVSTHIAPRKGRADLDEFRKRAIIYQKQFGRFLPKDRTSKIIDLGCGNGSIVWWLQQGGFLNAEGTDVSAEQVKAAKDLDLKNIKQGNLFEYIKNKKAFYDVIFLRDVIEHFNKEEIMLMLEFCYNSLTDNGIIIIQAPNAESPFGSRMRYGDFTHETSFTGASLSQILRSVGFNSIEGHPVELVVHGLKSLVRFILWKAIESFYKFLLLVESGRSEKIVTQNIIAVAKKKSVRDE